MYRSPHAAFLPYQRAIPIGAPFGLILVEIDQAAQTENYFSCQVGVGDEFEHVIGPDLHISDACIELPLVREVDGLEADVGGFLSRSAQRAASATAVS